MDGRGPTRGGEPPATPHPNPHRNMIPALRRPALAAVPALLLVAIAPLAGCELPFGTGTPDTITSLPRSLTEAEERTIRATNRFGFRLLGELHAGEPAENLFISPLSASMALGMAMNGADGRTFEATRSTLGFSERDLTSINESYRGLIELLRGLDPRVDFRLANAVWLQEAWPFRPDYRERVRSSFDARVENVDFRSPGLAERVNRWVRENTGGRITEFVSPGMVRDLVALLANTVYFEGKWRDRFDPDETAPGEFTRADGSTVSVPMMSHTMDEVALTRTDGGVRAADLPYGGRAFSMTVVLPARGTSLDSLVRAMDADAWRSITDRLGEGGEVRVRLPRFQLTWERLLNGALTRMGMGPAFSPDSADFSRMAETPPCTAGTGRCLYVDWVKQKSFVRVDEEGTEAAAATGVGVKPVSAPPAFRVDRPFLFAIRERHSGTVLFLGAVEDPTAG